MIPGVTSSSYAELSSGKTNLTQKQIDWLNEMGKKVEVDVNDSHHQAVIQAICRKTARGKKGKLYADKEF